MTTDDEWRIDIETESDDSPTEPDSPSQPEPEPADAEARRLEDELGRIAVRSTSEGYVEGQVTDLEAIDESTVRLEVALPHGRTVSFALEKPIPWSEEFLLARIVEDVGYDAASIGHVVGESVYVTRADLEDDDGGVWADLWSDPTRTTGRAIAALLESSLAERLETDDAGPSWRLVDPRERPESVEQDGSDAITFAIAAGLIVLGIVVAAAGAVFGATGSLAVSSAVIIYALPGLVLALAGGFAAYTVDWPGETAR